MKLKKEIAHLAIFGARAASAATVISYALGYQVPIVALQGAELLTVCLNTILLLMSVAGLLLLVGHSLYGTSLAKPPKEQAPLLKALLGLTFACELAAFALIGWWFTLGIRVTAFVIVKTMPREEATA